MLFYNTQTGPLGAIRTSYRRACFNELNETKTGGYGITGHNETSEPHNANWFIGVPNLGQ